MKRLPIVTRSQLRWQLTLCGLFPLLAIAWFALDRWGFGLAYTVISVGFASLYVLRYQRQQRAASRLPHD